MPRVTRRRVPPSSSGPHGSPWRPRGRPSPLGGGRLQYPVLTPEPPRAPGNAKGGEVLIEERCASVPRRGCDAAPPSREEGSSRLGANEGDVRASCPSACLRMSGREQDWAGLCLRIRKRVRILAAPGRTDTGRIKHSTSRFVRVPALLSRPVSPFVRASEKLSIGPRGVPPCRCPPPCGCGIPPKCGRRANRSRGLTSRGLG